MYRKILDMCSDYRICVGIRWAMCADMSDTVSVQHIGGKRCLKVWLERAIMSGKLPSFAQKMFNLSLWHEFSRTCLVLMCKDTRYSCLYIPHIQYLWKNEEKELPWAPPRLPWAQPIRLSHNHNIYGKRNKITTIYMEKRDAVQPAYHTKTQDVWGGG